MARAIPAPNLMRILIRILIRIVMRIAVLVRIPPAMEFRFCPDRLESSARIAG